MYPPLNTLKPVGENIWVVDSENISFYGLQFSTRMTVVRLASGDLFLHSPVKLTVELRDEVSKLGRVAHLVSPNWIHYAYIAEWADAFPDAKRWASPNVQKRAKKFKNKVQFNCNLDESADPAWASEINQIIVYGSKGHVEVVFFHKLSRTLILTDLIENFEASKVTFLPRLLFWLGGTLHPDGKMPRDIRVSFMFGLPTLRKAVETMIGWNPEKVILSHGRWYQKNGVAELKRAFRWLL